MTETSMRRAMQSFKVTLVTSSRRSGSFGSITSFVITMTGCMHTGLPHFQASRPRLGIKKILLGTLFLLRRELLSPGSLQSVCGQWKKPKSIQMEHLPSELLGNLASTTNTNRASPINKQLQFLSPLAQMGHQLA